MGHEKVNKAITTEIMVLAMTLTRLFVLAIATADVFGAVGMQQESIASGQVHVRDCGDICTHTLTFFTGKTEKASGFRGALGGEKDVEEDIEIKFIVSSELKAVHVKGFTE